LFLLPIIINLLLAWWIYQDATKLGVRDGLVPGSFDMGPGKWALGTAFLGVIWLAVYLSKRDQYAKLAAESSIDEDERIGEAEVAQPPRRRRTPEERRARSLERRRRLRK
jgi:hypothetical protein